MIFSEAKLISLWHANTIWHAKMILIQLRKDVYFLGAVMGNVPGCTLFVVSGKGEKLLGRGNLKKSFGGH